jgi:FdhD protein
MLDPSSSAGPCARDARVVDVAVERIRAGSRSSGDDVLAAEEPLEIRIEHGPRGARRRRSVSVTMRTPGADVVLAVGFLFAEGIIHEADDVARAASCGPPSGPLGIRNVVRVELAPTVRVDEKRLSRSFVSNSACGLCGKSSLEGLPPVPRTARRAPLIIQEALIHTLPDALRRTQAVFDRTGGLHAAALFDATGELLDVHEDVGRHNAVDKLIGAQLLARATPLSTRLMLVSGRAGYELVQKALVAGIPVLAAVGAPSSLAARLALEAGMTLIGFVRDGRFNIYSGAHRVA